MAARSAGARGAQGREGGRSMGGGGQRGRACPSEAFGRVSRCRIRRERQSDTKAKGGGQGQRKATEVRPEGRRVSG